WQKQAGKAMDKIFRTGVFLLFGVFCLPFFCGAQTKTVANRHTFWLAYMTSVRFSDKYSAWNDFHFVHETFGVARTGITRHLERTNITAGYAHLWLTPGGGNTSLIRNEHRPWAQVQFFMPVSGPYFLNQRFRYDARFRQKVASGETIDGYNFNHRLRFQMVLRRNFPSVFNGKAIPFVALADEVLLNFGKEVTHNTFDQNRASVALGLQVQKVQLQLGYMNRFAQSGPAASYLQDHILMMWVTQSFDLRRPKADLPLPVSP
ncbi:MAG TPA: DUF2490 domain-containing protein, partial [Adhaeribacter sp.]|nr:DUF2490 domain-containing protein [Adhaeribacter sp.]